jgi:hypothetical protein
MLNHRYKACIKSKLTVTYLKAELDVWFGKVYHPREHAHVYIYIMGATHTWLKTCWPISQVHFPT